MTPTFYQVGGSVRDELMGMTSKDIDYAVEADSFEAMKDAILIRGGNIFLEAPQFLTIRAKVPTLGACDFVLCRKDGAYSDGRHPDHVDVGTIYDDLARRDFTMNAIAKTSRNGVVEYIDPHGGTDDIKRKRIVCVGLAYDRFIEDGLRMLRALRFAITKDFQLATGIILCLQDREFLHGRLRNVSVERVREELMKCFAHDTNKTLVMLEHYPHLREYVFSLNNLWLKPTIEGR